MGSSFRYLPFGVFLKCQAWRFHSCASWLSARRNKLAAGSQIVGNGEARGGAFRLWQPALDGSGDSEPRASPLKPRGNRSFYKPLHLTMPPL